jgi:hypothetical protein
MIFKNTNVDLFREKISLLNGTFRNCLTQKEENARKSLKKEVLVFCF